MSTARNYRAHSKRERKSTREQRKYNQAHVHGVSLCPDLVQGDSFLCGGCILTSSTCVI